MRAIDLHIHTVATEKDSSFTFSLENLKNYVQQMGLDIIAITNHNIFDLKQFETIVDELEQTVLPGIEIDLEQGHLLLISDGKNLNDFSDKCNLVTENIKLKGYLSKDALFTIFGDLKEYLLIPHNPKKPKVPKEVIESFGDVITAVEVGSVKDFQREIKANSKYVPVWFSDYRASTEGGYNKCGRVYLDIEDNSFASIKYALKDKNKVHLSKEKSCSLFPINNKGFQISTGLNVVLGARSSGKSYLLDEIYRCNENVKYIEQFSLLNGKSENDKEFQGKLASKFSDVDNKLFKLFQESIIDVVDIDLAHEKKKIDEYAKSLVKFASDKERQDSFSKAQLFTQNEIGNKSLKSLNSLIHDLQNILENNEYSDIIFKYLDKKKLIQLIIELSDKAIKINTKNNMIEIANNIINETKRDLQFKSSSDKVEEIDFQDYIDKEMRVKYFNEICDKVKREQVFKLDKVGRFQIVMKTNAYSKVSEIKSRTGNQCSLQRAFQKYSVGYEYLQELKQIAKIPVTEYYKYFVDAQFDVLNEYGFSASGGERAEYNLLQEITSALNSDILLVDEPESSFDNPFLKEQVNELIKDIANKMPVVLVTHNNSVGVSIEPDYLIYTKRSINEKDEVKFERYTGMPSSDYLQSEESKIQTKKVLLDSFEAGEDAYSRRRMFYETHKN